MAWVFWLPAWLPPPALAASFEDTVLFAEKLADRWRMPDLALKHLQGLETADRILDKDRMALTGLKLFLLRKQVLQEPDPAKRESLVKLAEAWSQDVVDRIQTDAKSVQPRPGVSPDEFWAVFWHLRVLSACSRGASDAGPRIRKAHDLAMKTYVSLKEFARESGDEAYGDLLPEVRMADGELLLLVKEASGLTAAERLDLLKAGVDSFQDAWEYDERYPDVLGSPAACLGLARCWRLLAAEAYADPEGRKPLEECRKALNAALSLPLEPALSPAAAAEARYDAARELLDLALQQEGNLQEADRVVREFGRKVVQKGLGKDRSALLGARVDMARAASEKAIATATRIRQAGGPASGEAGQLLGEWEEDSGVRRRNWRAEAAKTLEAGRYPEAIRKYHAALVSVGKDDRLKASIWGYIGECYSQQGRPLQASIAFERAARGCPFWEKAGDCAALAYARCRQGTQGLSEASTAPRFRTLLELLVSFPAHKAAPEGLFQLGRLCVQQHDFEGAERSLMAVPAASARYLEALDALASVRMELVRRQESAGGPPPALLERALASNQAFLDRAKGPAAAEAWVRRSAARHAYLRIEVLSQREPAKALQFISEYPGTYPEAGERIAGLPALSAVAAGALGDWVLATAVWEQAVALAGDPPQGRPWPLLNAAKTLQGLSDASGKKGVQPAADLAARISAQISRFRPFDFHEAAGRFGDNYKAKRWAEAIVAAEQIRRNVTEDPQARQKAMKDGNAEWILEFEKRFPECYVGSGEWAKAVDPLLALQERMAIVQGVGKLAPGAPLPAECRKVWEWTATACTRVSLQMPAGDARKALALRACDSWRRLLEDAGVEDTGYWEMLLDAMRSQALAGRYEAAKDTIHGMFVTYPSLGGRKEGFLQAVLELACIEPGFASTAQEIASELTEGER